MTFDDKDEDHGDGGSLEVNLAMNMMNITLMMMVMMMTWVMLVMLVMMVTWVFLSIMSR